jgi:nucleoside-diphosphate-sugar epimerase
MTQSSTVLVLGGRGRFGSAAARAFSQAGWRVLAQLRPGATGPAIPGVQWLPVAPEDTCALAAAAAQAAVVVQGLSPVYTHQAWGSGVPRLTQAAIDVTRALGATLMLPASVYNFGHAMPSRLYEDTPQRPTTFKGRLRVASEAQVRAATEDGGMRAVVIRAGDFFGNGTGSWFDQLMVKRIARGKLTYPGAYDVPTAWAYLPDLARSFVQVSQVRDRLQPFENLHFTGHTLTGADWAEALGGIAREQGWLRGDARLSTASLPWPLWRLAGLAVPTLAALAEMRYLWRTPHALVNRRMAQLAGPEPHTPLAQAARAALGELGLLRSSSSFVNVTSKVQA